MVLGMITAVTLREGCHSLWPLKYAHLGVAAEWFGVQVEDME